MKRLYNRINKEELKEKVKANPGDRITLSFYKYAKIEDVQAFRDQLYEAWSKLTVYGRTYVAREGINAQISLPKDKFETFKTQLYEIPFLKQVRLNIAIEDDPRSFYVLKIKIRNKIVADGIEDSSFDSSDKGIHVDAKTFNELTDDPSTILIDMRNHYESEVGHFERAICPDVDTFKESLPIIKEMLVDKSGQKIVMYCTGGIRCEKASAFLKHNGFEDVYQLDGGIIEYARQVEQQGLKNKFKGKNFVFDERMGERISEEVLAHCHQCGTTCDSHVNCANDACHILFIQCDDCATKFEQCCSAKCKSFNQLPEDQQVELRKTEVFNGTKFGKSRYKAHKGGQLLQ